MALQFAYAQRRMFVAPISRSSSSLNGTFTPLPYTSLVLATSTFFMYLRHALMTMLVPSAIVSMVRTGSSHTSFTPTTLARWNTASASFTRRSTTRALQIVPFTKENFLLPFKDATFSSDPVLKSSSAVTTCPFFTSSSHRCPPIKPHPPVRSEEHTSELQSRI